MPQIVSPQAPYVRGDTTPSGAGFRIPAGAWWYVNDPAWVWAGITITARTPWSIMIQNIDPVAGQVLYLAMTNLFAPPGLGCVLPPIPVATGVPSPPMYFEDVTAPIYLAGFGIGTLANVIRLVRDPQYYG